MKEYLLVTGDFVKTGGMDRANFALADYLARQGNPVHLVAHRVTEELLAYPNIQFHQVLKPLNSYLLASPLLDQAGCYWARQITAKGGWVLVNGGNCQWGDVNWVHYVHSAYQPQVNGSLPRKLKTHWTHQSFLKNEKSALNSARLIIANSQRSQQDITNNLPHLVTKIKTVYYGVDPTIFYPASPTEKQQLRQQLDWLTETPIVTFIGALGDRRKGFDTLFQAWQKLCADPTWDANLMVIGRGAELPLWQERTEKLGLAQRIQFLGFRTDVPDLLRAADCLVAPTRYEAYGLGVHEALCCGLPAIVSANAGVAERYPSSLQDFLLSNPNNVEELQSCLQQWRLQSERYQPILLELSEKLRSYTWDDMARDIVALMTAHSI